MLQINWLPGSYRNSFGIFLLQSESFNFIFTIACNAKSFAIAFLFFFFLFPIRCHFRTDWQKLFVYFSNIAALSEGEQDRTF